MKYKKENKDSSHVLNYAYEGEIFRPVTNRMVNGVFDYYQVSNFGRLYHNYLKIIMKPALSTSGYLFVTLSTNRGSKIIQLHRLVLMAFNDICDRDKYQANHINGNKLCNYLWNLEWVTRSENIHHSYNTGLHPVEETSVLATIDNNTAKNICDLLQENRYTNKEIADLTNSTTSIVSSIKKGESWKNISKDYTFILRPGKLFTDEQINNLCKYFESNSIGNLTVKQHSKNALEYYGYNSSERSVDSIRKLYNHKYYTNISKNYNF